MKLITKQTGWVCAHVSVTAGVTLTDVSCGQGCTMQPIVAQYWTD